MYQEVETASGYEDKSEAALRVLVRGGKRGVNRYMGRRQISQPLHVVIPAAGTSNIFVGLPKIFTFARQTCSETLSYSILSSNCWEGSLVSLLAFIPWSAHHIGIGI